MSPADLNVLELIRLTQQSQLTQVLLSRIPLYTLHSIVKFLGKTKMNLMTQSQTRM